MASSPSLALAKKGEDFVAAWLTGHGYLCVTKNFRRKAAELDLIFQRGEALLVIEVKTRRAPLDDYQQLIPPRKLQALWRGLDRFLDEHPEYQSFTLHLGLALVTGLDQQADIQWMRLPTKV